MSVGSSTQQPQRTVFSMDDLLALITSCDSPAAVSTQLLPALHRLDREKKLTDVLLEPTSQGRDPLDVLQAPYGYGYFLILLHRCDVPDSDTAAMVARIAAFAHRCIPEELAIDGPRVAYLAEWARDQAWRSNQIDAVVEPIGELFSKLTGVLPEGVLTPLHQTLAYTCLQARAYDVAYRLLRSPVWDVDLTRAPITYHDNLQYHYYYGVICARVERYEEAIAALENVVAAPGSATAAVQLDAYKKLVLISYLGRGRAARVPKYTSVGVQNSFRGAHGEPYLALCEALLSTDLVTATSTLQKHIEIFRTDGNLGLVERCIERLRPQIILKLTETYIALSLVEIARHLGTSEPESPQSQRETERLVRSMIDRREIHADIESDASGVGATVSFSSDPEPYNTVESVQMIDRHAQRATGLGDSVRARAMQIGASKEFLQKAMQAVNQGSAAPAFAGMADDEEGLDFGPGMMRDPAGDNFYFDDS